MKRKDDDLLRLAFGELSAEEARATEARVVGDASARAELESLRDLRMGLQNLPPPPPDNLSAERLRAAILDRDLRQRRPAPFAWAWAPVAMAVLAVAFVARPFAHSIPSGEPTIVAPNTAVARNETLDTPDFNDPYSAPSSVEAQLKPAPVAKAMVAKVADATTPPPVERRVRHRTPRRAESEQPQTTFKDLVALNQGRQDAAMMVARREPETMAAPMSTIVPNPQDAGGPDSVIIVSSKRDLDTGANAATETEATNVLVGG